MATEVKLPQLGQTMEEGTIVSCLVKVGDEVKKGDVIFEVETDKATLEVESPAKGFVKHIVAESGQTLPVGDTIIVLGEKNEDVPCPATKAVSQSAPPPTPAPSVSTAAPALKPQPLIPIGAPSCANVIKLPQLGQTMEEGTIVSCLVKVGDEVKKGDLVFEIETDKATLEMESPQSGFVKCILADNGQTIPVGDPVLILAGKDDKIPQDFIDSLKTGSSAEAVAAGTPTQAVTAPVATQESFKSKPVGKVIASPRAKKLASDLGIDISTVTGTGPSGGITEKDVKAASKSKPAPAPAAELKLGTTVPLNKLQRITGERMVQSKHEIPCFYLNMKVDMTDLVAYRAKLNQTSDVKVAFNDFLIRAVASGLEHYPIMTGQLSGDNIDLAETINVGLAMSVPDGLIVPAVKDAQKKTVVQIARETKALIEKARTNKLLLTDLEGGVITISNLGAFGVESFIPIVVPGQCSILGVGKITDTCVPSEGGIAIRKLMNITLSVDHKVANGAYAAQFLEFVKETLQDCSNFS